MLHAHSRAESTTTPLTMDRESVVFDVATLAIHCLGESDAAIV